MTGAGEKAYCAGGDIRGIYYPLLVLDLGLLGMCDLGNTLLQDYSISFVVIQRVQIFVKKKFTNVFSKLESPSFAVEVIRSFYFQCC